MGRGRKEGPERGGEGRGSKKGAQSGCALAVTDALWALLPRHPSRHPFKAGAANSISSKPQLAYWSSLGTLSPRALPWEMTQPLQREAGLTAALTSNRPSHVTGTGHRGEGVSARKHIGCSSRGRWEAAHAGRIAWVTVNGKAHRMFMLHLQLAHILLACICQRRRGKHASHPQPHLEGPTCLVDLGNHWAAVC